MKFFFSLMVTGFAIAAHAQNNMIHVLPKNQKPVIEISELIDTTNMYASKYGNVARLTYDNMPCIMPYNNTVKMPNTAEGKRMPLDIPNGWEYRNKKLTDTMIKTLPPYPKHPKFYSPPNPWRKDSASGR